MPAVTGKKKAKKTVEVKEAAFEEKEVVVCHVATHSVCVNNLLARALLKCSKWSLIYIKTECRNNQN